MNGGLSLRGWGRAWAGEQGVRQEGLGAWFLLLPKDREREKKRKRKISAKQSLLLIPQFPASVLQPLEFAGGIIMVRKAALKEEVTGEPVWLSVP